jgi:cell division protein FtsA
VEKNYIIAIDLGSSNITVAVAEVDKGKGLIPRSVISKPSRGIVGGLIVNLEDAVESISAAVNAVNKELHIRIKEAYVGISGEFVRCARHTEYVFTKDPQHGVSQIDVDKLFERMSNVQAPDGERILERTPQSYVIDDYETDKPIGTFGRILTSTYSFFLSTQTPIDRIHLALSRLGIDILGIKANAMVVADAVLESDEKEEGVAVVNIGSDVTDVAVYYHNILRYIASIPIGGRSINTDICTLGIPKQYVEQLKIRYGNAVASAIAKDKKSLIKVSKRTPKDPDKHISNTNLALVIGARLTDIAEYATREIDRSGYREKLAYGIVLTGGSAKIPNISELFQQVTGMQARIGAPEFAVADIEEARKLVSSSATSTIVGLLLHCAESGFCAYDIEPRQEPSPQPAPKPIPPKPPVQQPSVSPITPPTPKPKDAPKGDEPQKPNGGWFASIMTIINDTINRTGDGSDDEEI